MLQGRKTKTKQKQKQPDQVTEENKFLLNRYDSEMTPNPKENKPKPGPSPENTESTSQDEQQASGEENEEEEEEVDVSLDEFDSVNNYLDSLNTALDAIEQRNDDLKAQLLNLLQSNREIRQSMQEENAKRPGSDDGAEPEVATGDAMEH